MEELNRLQQWYKLHCDGDWEHVYGIRIETMDNPGWKLSVDLTDTLLEEAAFTPIERGDCEGCGSWICCRKEGDCFVGMGGSQDLTELIDIFLQWADQSTDTKPWDSDVERLLTLCKAENDPMCLRKIYAEINGIPMEHPRRGELLDAFYKKWNRLLSEGAIR